VFTPDFIDKYWHRSFPGAMVLRIAGAGHHLQEDAHEQLVPALMDFLERALAASRNMNNSNL